MIRCAVIFPLILIMLVGPVSGQELIIQENETGHCATDGIFQTDVGGYTGSGYINVDAGIGASISWNILAPDAGTYHLRWRYAIGGNIGDRPGRLLINGVVAIDTVDFPHTGAWDSETP